MLDWIIDSRKKLCSTWIADDNLGGNILLQIMSPIWLLMFTFQDGEENGAPGGGFNQAEDNSQVDLVGWVGRGCVALQTHAEKDC